MHICRWICWNSSSTTDVNLPSPTSPYTFLLLFFFLHFLLFLVILLLYLLALLSSSTSYTTSFSSPEGQNLCVFTNIINPLTHPLQKRGSGSGSDL